MPHTVLSTGRRLRALPAVLALVATTLGATAAHAADPGWVANRQVKKIVVTMQGGFNVLVSPGLTGCTSQSGYGDTWASIYPTHPGVNRMMALLMTAQTSGKRVNLYFYDNNCSVSEAVLNED
ncbi:hypothetical protein [Mitsuaria sp. GD03876]|uniref:hypothetical protein n=1 Tax=Mitsuaria sp. GD03876 TaxID=2975399 RepID=UPI00244998EB|nr:hypothetical protein [Mitsuaria sp. GD03876]MDH0864251.1 hypothetical protein [Mitsuaria sp. GD03876]